MSVIGLDVGNESCVIAYAKRGGIDVLLNDESGCETPAVVSFGAKQRFLGRAGAAFATENPKSTISQVKRLIGRPYNEPSVQEELKLLPFATSEGPRGGVLIELEYLKRIWTFTPVEILGMLFTHLKQITEKNLESPVVDCVIGIPSYFTDFQRREYLDAAAIAGLRPIMLIHDCTAIALGYGMYKTDLSNSTPTNVMFVDIGQCDTQVTVASFKQGQMKILSHSFDQNLGGRDFDEVLFKHFAAKFQEQYKIDVCTNARACIRLRASCEKLKKVLTANADAPISMERLIEDNDVKGFITREDFEKLSSELLERVTVACNKALKDSGLSVDKIHTIELVGSGSQIPAIMRILTSFFQKEPTRTLNASECVARGCALRCAMFSPTLVVRDYKIEDIYPYSIALPRPRGDIILFSKGSPFPSDKTLKHDGNVAFDFPVSYTHDPDFPVGISPVIGRFMIGPSEPSDAENKKVQFKVKLNDHGIFEIDYAWIVEDKHYSARSVYSYLGIMSDIDVLNIPFSENLHVATTKDELRVAKEREKMLAEQDMKVEQAKDQRNTLESFVYDTRSKLSSAYQSFATDSEKEGLNKSLQETEDWLYEDSDDESEQDYTGKLEDLKKLLEPIENRYKEENARTKAVKALQTCVAKYRSLADSLPANQKEKVKDLCNRTEHWLQPDSFLKGSSSYINEAIESFESGCRSMMRPKPSYPRHESVDSNKRDQRSTLKSFVYDTRSKLSNAYRSFATDLEKEGLAKILQETEDWLYEDNDDASEQDFAGKLEDLKKLFEPIENRYKEENARTKAVKALQTCIEKYRSVADSLPGDQKEEVKVLCNRAEHWLQQDSSLKASSSYINEAIEAFESGCRRMMRPKPSYPRYEPVDSNERYQRSTLELFIHDARSKLSSAYQSFAKDSEKEVITSILRETEDWLCKESEQDYTGRLEYLKKLLEPIKNRYKEENARAKAVKALQTCIVKYRSFADSLPAGKKKEVKNECNKAEMWLNHIGQQHSSPKNSSSCINQVIIDFESNCKYKMRPFQMYDETAISYQMDQLVVSDQIEEPADSNQADQPVDSNKSDQHMDSNTRNQPVDLNKRDQPEKSNKVDQPVKSNKRDQPVKSNKRDQHVRSNKKDQPVDSNKSDQTVASNKREQPVDSNRMEQPVDMDKGDQYDDMQVNKKSFPRHEPVDSIKRDQRSVLELFIHDARKKVSSAYQSFATDSEKEVITNILKETEDWLYNESEQVYTRKLEYLKKLLEPIENRYQEENARAKAVKALKTCIAKYCSLADSLPAGKKEEVKNECNKAEMWLNRIVQQHSSSKNSSSYINQVITDFESNCKYKMRPSKYDESIFSDQMDSDLVEEPVDSNQTDQLVDSKQMDHLVESNKRDQLVNSNKREQLGKSNKREQLAKSNKREQHMDSNKREQPANSNKREQSVDLNRRERPVDLDK